MACHDNPKFISHTFSRAGYNSQAIGSTGAIIGRAKGRQDLNDWAIQAERMRAQAASMPESKAKSELKAKAEQLLQAYLMNEIINNKTAH